MRRVSVSRTFTRIRIVRGGAPRRPAIWFSPSLAEDADGAARHGELRGDRLLGAEGVVDHREHVCVLERERAPPGRRRADGRRPRSRSRRGRPPSRSSPARGRRRRFPRTPPSPGRRSCAGKPPSGPDGAASTEPAGPFGRARQAAPDRRRQARHRERRGDPPGAAAQSRRAAGGSRHLRRLLEDLLDRRGQRDLVPELADALGDGPGVSAHAVAALAVDRRPGEAGAHPGRVDGGTGDADEEARARRGGVAADDVDHLDVELRDGGAADHRQALAVHARAHVREPHDRVRRPRRRDRPEGCDQAGRERQSVPHAGEASACRRKFP